MINFQLDVEYALTRNTRRVNARNFKRNLIGGGRNMHNLSPYIIRKKEKTLW